jgi:Domain of unknown function (DUF4160)
MPEISRFFGIVILMHYDDHPPPHFHARYGGDKAILGIDIPITLEGRLPPRVLGLVIEWALLHRDELMDNWGRARRQEPMRRIAPLE